MTVPLHLIKYRRVEGGLWWSDQNDQKWKTAFVQGMAEWEPLSQEWENWAGDMTNVCRAVSGRKGVNDWIYRGKACWGPLIQEVRVGNLLEMGNYPRKKHCVLVMLKEIPSAGFCTQSTGLGGHFPWCGASNFKILWWICYLWLHK